MEEKKQGSKRKTVVIVLAAVAVISLVAGGALIISFKQKANANAPKPDDLQIVTANSSYQQYEIRNDELLLSYRITLYNPSDKEQSGFRIAGLFKKDFENGVILDSRAPAREKLTGREMFSIAAGEKKMFNLVFAASYFRNENKPSQTMPSIIITTSDGREIEISNAE